MSQYIYAIHDEGGQHLMADAPGTIVYTFNVTDPPLDFSGLAAQGFRAIARINHSHHGNGTIPPDSNDWPAFAQACAAFVAGCRGVRDFTIANEPNIAAEWGRDEPVTPEQYAECYRLVYDAVKDRAPDAQIAPAAIGPWNVQSGVEWIEYFRRVLINVERIDWINLHAYSRGYGPRDVTDNSWMDAPHQNRRSGFRAYKDFLDAVPAVLKALPVDITESNGNGAWPDENTGWVQAVYGEVVRHNEHPGSQKIRSLALFRWLHFEGQPWGFEHKANVHEDFRRAVAKRYAAPTVETAGPDPDEPDIFVPTVSTGGERPMPDLPEREIGGDFRARVPEIKLSDGVGDKPHYRLIRAEYVPNAAARFGPDHHILVDVLDADGARVLGVPVNVWWGTGAAIKATTKPAGPYALDYAMHNAGHSFGVKVADDNATSDSAFGMGLGKIGSEHIADHVGYYLVFREAKPQVRPVVPRPQPGETEGDPPPSNSDPESGALIWPVQGWVSQRWGERPEYYRAAFGIPFHNGTDIAASAGRAIEAIADGEVMFVGEDVDYGLYCRIYHPAHGFHSFYAHNRENLVQAGQQVEQGDTIARVGSTGNSTGAHVHWEIRLGSRNTYAQGAFGHTRGRVDPETVFYVLEQGLPVGAAVDSVVGDANWARAHPIVLQIEGGLSLDPADTGNYYNGELVGTKYGISAAQWGGQYDIPNLTKEQALQIYHQHYWLRSGADKLPWPLALVHFDAFVQNEAAARQLLQTSGGNAVRYMAERIEWYTRVPTTWQDHGRGWMRRCARILREVAK